MSKYPKVRLVYPQGPLAGDQLWSLRGGRRRRGEAAPGPGAGGTSPLPGLQSNPSWEGGAGVLKMQNAKDANCKTWREAETGSAGSSPLAGPQSNPSWEGGATLPLYQHLPNPTTSW